ncbi:MAG: hypothetical protein ACOCUT_04445 [bacterium]
MGASLISLGFGLFKDFPQEYSNIETLLLSGGLFGFMGCGVGLVKSITDADYHTKEINRLRRKDEANR